MAANRKDVRKKMAELLETALGAGAPTQLVQAFYKSQPRDFGGASPVVTVSGAGSDRPRMTQGAGRSTFWLNVHVFVVFALADGSWTEDDAEDRLDDIEAAVAAVIQNNRRLSGFWEALDYESRSAAGSVEVGGVEYRREVIPLKVEVYS